MKILLTDDEIMKAITNLNPYVMHRPRAVAKAQLKKVSEQLDIKFIIGILIQADDMIWTGKGQNICKEQVTKLKALLREIK